MKQRVDERYGAGQTNVFLNVAAPMNHYGDEILRTRYLRIIQAAWEAVYGENPFEVHQGSSLDELQARLEPFLDDDRAVPDRETRRYSVLPETLAPLVSLSLDPRAEPGMYMVVDMGAGTTEISVDHVGEPEDIDQQILCYQGLILDQSAAIISQLLTRYLNPSAFGNSSILGW